MKKALLVATGGAVGYIMGARAGRERYESIRDGSRTLRDKSQALMSSTAGLVERRWPETSEPIRKLGIAEEDETTLRLDDEPNSQASYSSSSASSSLE